MSATDHEAAEQLATFYGTLTKPRDSAADNPVFNLARCYQATRAREARLEALVRSLGKCSWCCGYGYREEYVSDVETERYQCGRCAGTGLVEAARKELSHESC